MYETIASPVNYGGIRLKNRIIFAPTTLGLKGDAYQAKLQEIARGGCAMIILGDVPVGKHGFGQSLFTAKGFTAYQRITETIHREGCLVCAQLHQSDSNLKGMLKYIPGVLTKRISMEDLRPLLNEQVSPYITGLPEKKVRQITASFGPAAVQAQKAGFDMVQIHGDRMCGSFASPLFNHRTDAYGGSLENRIRFAVEAVQAVRRHCRTCPLTLSWPFARKIPTMATRACWWRSCKPWFPCWKRRGSPAFMWPRPITPP